MPKNYASYIRQPWPFRFLQNFWVQRFLHLYCFRGLLKPSAVDWMNRRIDRRHCAFSTPESWIANVSRLRIVAAGWLYVGMLVAVRCCWYVGVL